MTDARHVGIDATPRVEFREHGRSTLQSNAVNRQQTESLSQYGGESAIRLGAKYPYLDSNLYISPFQRGSCSMCLSIILQQTAADCRIGVGGGVSARGCGPG